MTVGMRYPVLIILCLISLVAAGPVSAACATDLAGWAEAPTTVQNGSAGVTDCDMGQNNRSQHKAPKCNHDACCGLQLVEVSGFGDVEMPAPPVALVTAPVTKQLTGSGGDPLLDPPRA